MLRKIKLHNFKCFDDIEIPFNNLTLLAGGNGSGKSTIVQSLLLIAQSFYESKELTSIHFMGKYVKLGYSNDIFYEFNNSEPTLGFNIKFDEGEISLNAKYISEETKLNAQCDGKIIDNVGLFNNNFEYISAERISPDKVFSSFSNDFNIGIHGENVMNYINKYGMKQINEELCVENIDNVLVLQLDYWLSKLFNGFCIKFEEVLKADIINLRYQEVTSQDKSNERRPINVGFGITYILPVLVSLLKSQPGDLVIIENPESHLHPKAQRLIGELLARVANVGVQVIVETHSDHVLNGIRLSVKNNIIEKENTQILFVSREDVGTNYHTNVYTPNIQSNGDLDIWPEGFFDEWDNALFSLLG